MNHLCFLSLSVLFDISIQQTDDRRIKASGAA
jgi:hypothetical protein